MKTLLAVLTLLTASMAMGQVTASAPASRTTGALNYFYETTGNDANKCWSTAATCVAPGCLPCLTFQGTLNKIPKTIRHQTQVIGGVGSFAGGVVSGFTFEGVAGPTLPGMLILKGTLIPFVPAASGATGTATAVAEGNVNASAPGMYGTLTDSGKAWAVNNLRGRILEITGGPGVGQLRTIESNTATVITISSPWAAGQQFTLPQSGNSQVLPTTSSTYAIRDWGTALNSGFPPSVDYDFFLNFNPATRVTLQILTPNTGINIAPSGVVVDQLKFSGAGFPLIQGIRVQGSGPINVLRNRFEMAFSVNGQITMQNSNGGLFAYNSVLGNATAPSAWVAWVLVSPPTGQNAFIGNVVDDGQFGVSGLKGWMPMNGNSFRGQSGAAIEIEDTTDGPIAQNVINCALVDGGVATGRGIGTRALSTGRGQGKNSYIGNSISNCTIGIELRGNYSAHSVGLTGAASIPQVGTGNTTAVSVAEGATYTVQAGDTLTGTNEFLIDGTGYTKADVESLTPKSVGGISGARVYQP